jgi:hypothetical protein
MPVLLKAQVFFCPAPSPDGQKEKYPLCPPCLCGKKKYYGKYVTVITNKSAKAQKGLLPTLFLCALVATLPARPGWVVLNRIWLYLNRSAENGFREIERNDPIGLVDDLADLQARAHAAQHIRLCTRQAVFCRNQVDHVTDRNFGRCY